VRGEDADVIVMEEAAFIGEEVFHTGIVPLMGVGRTAVLAISTPGDDDNYYSVLLGKRKANGDPLFRTIPVGLACEECREAGKASECKHKVRELPSWKSDERHELTKELLPTEKFNAEAQGLIGSAENVAFSRGEIERLFRRPAQPLTVKTRAIVYVACDPTGAGNSRFALIAFMWAHPVDTPTTQTITEDRANLVV
jgi:hypothetical protein